tara:strand:- start:433 stop:804 length:372 start_codon:yes stop_codon:yes gene_type:complete
MAFKMKGFPMMGDLANDQLKSQVGDGTNNVMLETEKQLQAYNDHMAQMPQFEKGAGIGSHFNTLMKRIIHNETAPTHPYRYGGGGGLDLVGGKGFVKGANFLKNALKHVLKSGAKTGAKKINT